MSDIENSQGPIEDAYREKMNVLAKVLDEMFNPDGERKIGFTLLIFELNTAGRMNYISTAEREPMICAMKELLANWEGRKLRETEA